MTTEALTAIKAALAAGPTGWDNPRGAGPATLHDIDASAISSLISSYEAMERRVAELEEALTPFADVGDLILAEAPPESNYWEAFASCDGQTYHISLEYLRRARSALTPTVEKVETPAQAPAPETHTLGRFGHHADPANDFCIEVEAIQGQLFDATHGISKPGTVPATIEEVRERIERAMEFHVGADEIAVVAKQTLRRLEKEAEGQP